MKYFIVVVFHRVSKLSTGFQIHPMYPNDLLTGTCSEMNVYVIPDLLHESIQLARRSQNTVTVEGHDAIESSANIDISLQSNMKEQAIPLKLMPRWSSKILERQSIDCCRWVPWQRGRILVADKTSYAIFL